MIKLFLSWVYISKNEEQGPKQIPLHQYLLQCYSQYRNNPVFINRQMAKQNLVTYFFSEYYSAIKMNEVQVQATTWINCELLLLT